MTSSPGFSASRDLSSVSSSFESKGVLDTSEKERNMSTRASAGIAGSPESFMWDFGWSRKSEALVVDVGDGLSVATVSCLGAVRNTET